MPRIELPPGDLPERYRVFGLQPEMGKALVGLSQAIYEKSIVDKRVREAVRMRIAQINQCQICLGYRFPELRELGVDEAFYEAVTDWRNATLFSEGEKIAIDYAERFLTDHLSIDNAFMARMGEFFSAAEIFDLTGIIGGLLANGRMMQVLQIEHSCALDSAVE